MNLELYEFYKIYNAIKNYKGIGTELISLYIPAKKNKHQIIQKLKEEQAQAENIKLKNTKKIVCKGLETIISYLKQNEIYKNGLILFAHENTFFILKPPKLNLKYSYSCNDVFITDDLLNFIILNNNLYGLLVLDASEACFATLTNENLTIIKDFESYIPGKTKKGGQSARRYAEIRKNETIDFFKKITETINNTLLPVLKNTLKIYVGGITPTIEEFITLHPDLDLRLVKKLSEPYYIPYTNRMGLKMLIKLIQKDLDNDKYARQLNLFELINKSKILTDKNIDEVYSSFNISHIIICESYIEPEIDFLKTILIHNPNCIFEIIMLDTEIGKNISALYNGFVCILNA